MSDEEILAEMEKRFGEHDTKQYLVLAKATRAMVRLWAEYAKTPADSAMERLVEAHLNQMMEGLRTRPDHAIGMIESLLAIVHHMRNGGTYEDWFRSVGLNPEPGEDK